MFESQGSLISHVAMALASDGYRTVIHTGGGILLLGLSLSLILEWVKFYQGERPNWSGPVTRVLVTSLGLAAFPFLIQMVVAGVAVFGDLEEGTKVASQVFQLRTDRFLSNGRQKEFKANPTIHTVPPLRGMMPSRSRVPTDSNANVSEKLPDVPVGNSSNGIIGSMVDDLKADLLYWITLLLQYITIALIHSIKVIQSLLLKVLIYLGPVMIAMGVLPGPFKNFPVNWFMLFFSVSFWSVVMNALLKMLAESTRQIPQGGINLSEEIITSFVWIFLILAVPMLSTALVNGGGFSGVIGESAASASNAMRGGGAIAMGALKKFTGGR